MITAGCNVSHIAYLSLGSNSSNPVLMLEQAVKLIAILPGVHILSRSSIWFTEPQDYAEQQWFHNIILKISAAFHWDHASLLANLLNLETIMGRKRGKQRFGPRRIDIDLLLFDDINSDDVPCQLPHPRMLKRAFVLVPLCEIAPELRILGKTAAQWLRRLPYRVEDNRIYQR